MMQSELLDITMIGFLVLLFGSTYRKRPSPVVRAWLLGWILILLHFAALLFHPSGVIASRVLLCLSLGALVACGVVFLSMPPRERSPIDRDPAFALAVAAGSMLACVVLSVSDVKLLTPYLVACAVATAAWIVYVVGLRDVSPFVRGLLLVAVAATAAWSGWAIWHAEFDILLSALLTQIYVLVGIAYIGTVRRISAGTLTTSLGLVAWAAVFPTAEWLDHLHMSSRVPPEFWNIPKYFVAFGMILMLLEEEIIAANEAGRTLSFQASHDQLTGLRNRFSLEQDLRAAVELAQRRAGKCALICFDLDRFKHINDTYGHGVGDICLQVTGERLTRLASDRRTSARIGGEEFGLVLSDTGLEEAQSVARQVQLALREPVRAEGFLIDITASVGIAVFPEDGADPPTLWRNADSAMYRAKRTGGNQIVSMSPEILRLTAESNDMERSLRHALRESGLELQYQPIFRADGRIHSVEALVRLRHPELGLILPGRFISVGEERGLIVPLGDWVFKEVCAQLASWRSRDLPQVPIAMNISALQITSSNFASGVLDVLSQFDIDPSLIAMEITETAMLRNVVEAARQIDILAAAGVSFSVDDFGVGYSSLGQLDELDVDYLKIDRSFVGRMCDVDEARSIVTAIISMAHGLGLQVVAEGVEDQCSLDHLANMGCDLFQGFFLGQPKTSAELETLLMRTTDTGTPVPQNLAARLSASL